MSTILYEESPITVRLNDGSEINFFELSKENTSNRGVHDSIAALADISDPAHKDIAYVVSEGAVMAFINGEWVRPGPALTSIEDITNAIHNNEYLKLIAGFSARVDVLKVVDSNV